MANLLNQLKTNLNSYKETNTDREVDYDLSIKVFRKIKKRMLVQSAVGVKEFAYNPRLIPLGVDEMFRKEGLIVWRNSEVVKYVVPMEVD